MILKNNSQHLGLSVGNTHTARANFVLPFFDFNSPDVRLRLVRCCIEKWRAKDRV